MHTNKQLRSNVVLPSHWLWSQPLFLVPCWNQNPEIKVLLVEDGAQSFPFSNACQSFWIGLVMEVKVHVPRADETLAPTNGKKEMSSKIIQVSNCGGGEICCVVPTLSQKPFFYSGTFNTVSMTISFNSFPNNCPDNDGLTDSLTLFLLSMITLTQPLN